MSANVTSVGFIGAGKIATALARGFLASGKIAKDRIIASAPTTEETASIKVRIVLCILGYAQTPICCRLSLWLLLYIYV